jgi:Patatin-like phospholipase
LYLAHPADYGNEVFYQDGVGIAQRLRTAHPLWKDSLFSALISVYRTYADKSDRSAGQLCLMDDIPPGIYGCSRDYHKILDEHAAHEVRLGDWFDLIGGTSTGAIIAAALALGHRTSFVKDIYFRLAPTKLGAGLVVCGSVRTAMRPMVT